jgi:putative hydrolase of the HAD superfamily
VAKLLAVTLDATGTLFAPRDLGAEYARVLARHGLALPADELARAIRLAWQELGCVVDPARDRFAGAGGAPAYWRRVVERVCALAGAPPPSRFAVAELYERFAEPGAWRVFDDVLPALAGLHAAGFRLALISNWDERLPRLLERLELARWFDTLVISSAVGVEKPHRRIFEVALARLEAPATGVLHVGDSARDDVEGALAVGCRALLLDRSGHGGDLASLAPLVERCVALA